MIRGIIALALLGVAFASRSANQYVDNVIQTSFPNEVRALGLDPAPLPNFNVHFGPQTVYQSQGQANFTYGNVTGLPLLRRKSDCAGPKLFRGEYTINCTLSLFPLATNYRVIARNGTTVSNARVFGNVAETLIYVIISGNQQSSVGSVKAFQITHLGQINPTITGLAPTFNKYVKVLQDTYRSTVSPYLFNVIQQRLVYALGRALAYKPMPKQ